MSIKELREKIQRRLRRKYHWHTWNQLWRSNNPTREYKLMKQTKHEGSAYADNGKLVKCNITEDLWFTFYPELPGRRKAIVLILQRKAYRRLDGKLIDVEYTTSELTLEEFKLIFAAIFNVNHEDIIRKEKRDVI